MKVIVEINETPRGVELSFQAFVKDASNKEKYYADALGEVFKECIPIIAKNAGCNKVSMFGDPTNG